jgi:hypothetical protein
VYHPPASRLPLGGGPILRVHPKRSGPRTPLKLMVPRDRVTGLLVVTRSRCLVQLLQQVLQLR